MLGLLTHITLSVSEGAVAYSSYHLFPCTDAPALALLHDSLMHQT